MNKNVAFATMERFDNRTLNSVGSSRIRARWLLPFWDEAEEYVIGKKYDVLIFQKVYWGAMMQAFEGIKILDLADPDWLENKPVFEYVDMADAVTTSTEPLADYVRKMRPKALVQCIPDRIYLPEATPVHAKHKGRLKKVVWFGYAHNSKYLFNTFDQIISKNLELITISDSVVETTLMYRDKINITHVPYSYESVNKEMVKADAVLMPEPFGDERAKFKSNNKTIQAKSLGMPVVKVPEDLDRLMTAEAREAEAEMGLKEVKEKYDVRFSVEEYKQLIQEIKKSK